MKRKFTFLIAAAFMLLTMMATTGTMWGQTRTEEVAYTLQPASGSNYSYAGNCDITINDIKWNLTGNSTMQPWRIGGKSLDGVDRSLYSKTAISDNITKIEVTHGAASGITINSWTVIVASDASFSTVVSTLTPTFAASTTTTINRPENKDWTGCYYKFVYNVTVSGSSNKFLEFSQAKFYKEVSGNTPYIDADDVEIAYNATSGSIEYSVENGEGNVTAEITTGGDWLTSLGTITATEVPFTCSTNEGAAERTATVTLSFDGAQDKVVTVTQAGNPNAVDNISDITATGTYTVKGTIVAKSTRGFIVGDGTGYVYYYNTNYDQNAYNIGDKVKLAGNVSVYGGVYQYTSSATITSVETSNYVTEDPTVLSGADMDARVASTTPPQLSNYIQYVGKLTVSGNYYNITDIEGATTAKGSISYPTSTDFASLDGKVVTVTGYYVGISSSTYYNTMIGSIEEVYTEIEAPTFSVAAGGYAETQTVAISCATDGAQIYYTTDGSEPTKGSFLYDEELDIEETTTIKAIAYVGENASTVSTAAYYILSNENTYTVAEALAFETYPQNNIFVEGIVSTAPTSLISGGMLTYYISADGTSNELHDNELQVYKGKNLDNAVFTAVDNIQVGDVVTIFGNVKVYNSQKEFDQGNYLVTWERLETVATPTFTPKEGGYTEAQSVTIACTTEDATIYYKTEENAEWAVYSEAIDVAETTTIWAYAAKEGMNNSAVATATYTINIPVSTPSITVDPATVEATAEGEDGTLTVTYENITISEASDFGIQFYDGEENELNDEPDWLVVIVEAAEPSGYEVSYSIEDNDGAARTAYFKVFAMGSEDFVYSNLVTINQAAYVPPVVADNYELFNGDLEEGDYIIYYYNNDGYALKNEELNATGRLSYEVVTPENDVISTADATIVWHIAPSSEYWTIYSADADAYAASTGAKNKAQMLADGTDDKAMWTVSGDETYEFINKANSAANVNCNLRNNGTNGWACYATSTGGALSLYKKVDNTPSLSFNGSSANIGTYAVDEEIVWDNITITQHNLTENISLSAKKGTVNPASIVAGAEPTQVTWSYTPTAAGYTTDTITATSGTLQATLIIQFMAKTPHSIDTVAENGIIVVLGDKTTAIENENIDFTVTPNEGYVIDEITVMAGEAPVDFNDYETFYRFQMPDSDVTISATFTALPTYTVSFSVNGTVDSELTETVTTGSSIEDLPTESTLTPDGFTIYGWAEANSTEAVAEPYEPTGDVILYALLQLENAPATTENYVKVTEELTDWSGEYLIVYEDGNVAFNSAINPFDAVKNTVEVNITSSIIYSSTDMNNAAFTIASMTNGYSIQGTNGKYIGVASYNNGLTTNDNPVANTISIDELGNVSIVVATTGGDMTLKYNDANNQLRFRYYKSGQKDIQLYKKTSGAAIPTIINVEYVSGTTPMSTNIPESTCYVVEDGAVLTFTGTNEGTAANLVVQEGGQLIHAADVEATVQIGVSGYGSKSGDGWYLISSPVDDLPTSAVATGTYDLFAYDEATAMWWVDHAIPGQTAQHTFNTLTRGKGYLYANTADVNLNYAGTMKATNANITVNLSYACDDYPELKGYNLVGNPFSRNLTANDMKIGEDELGDDINVTLYYDFDATGTELEVKVTNDEPIKPGHGFFIQANENNPELVFNPSSTKDANEIGLISIEAGDESYIDKAYIQFGGGNTLRKMTFSGDKSQVYVINNREDFAAARFDDAKGSIPVHFKAAADGNYTINIEATNLDFEYFRLLDTFTGEEIDLLAESGYKFQASSEDPAERFILLFQIGNINGVDENDAASVVFVYQNGDELFFNGDGTLQVFDMMGRFVMSREIHGNDRISTSMFNTGVYVFRLVGETVMTQKIVVR